MKLFISVLFFIYTLHSFSQKKESHNPLSDKNSSLTTVFSTYIKPINILLSQRLDTINPSIFGRVNKLNEVYIKPKSEFNAVSLGIIKEEIKPLSVYERRLYTAGDFKPIHLLNILGGSLAVDPIINAINGRTKKMKKHIEIERKESNLIFLEDYFLKYMTENLHIEDSIRGRFLTYLIANQNLQNFIDRKAFGELHFLIGDEWFKFKQLQSETPLNSIDEVIMD